ncbi:mRNA-decapping enzyme subunit 2 [Yarrowia sp. C11]|nr:mRNA-decapping enzyme subunit 2 [Yarrowia sp. E02]KAG5371630.1 mRNA-decapping enzyme subunit 2 [Yarrowia sp. C11]
MSIELRSPYSGSLKECIQDLVVRFIINVPKEDLQTIERIFFQIEEAQWYYEDFVRELNPKLPSLKMPKFAQHIYEYCPQLWNIKDIKSSIKTFRDYKLTIPVCGAIIMTPKMNKILLVQAYDGNSWGFPRGKISKDESKEKCAVREVYEEIGFDISPYLKPDKYVDIRMKGKDFRLYLVRGVPQDTVFETQTRKEISKIEWRDLKSMPGYARKKGSSNHFFMVTPFVPGLLKFIAQEKGLEVNDVGDTDNVGETDAAESAVDLPVPAAAPEPVNNQMYNNNQTQQMPPALPTNLPFAPPPFFGNFGPTPFAPPGFGPPQGFPMPFMGAPGPGLPPPAQFSDFQQMPQFQEFQEELQEAVGEPEPLKEVVNEVAKPVEPVITPRAPPPPSQLLLEGALRARKRDMSNAHSLLSALRSGGPASSPGASHMSSASSGKAESLMALLNNPASSSKPVVRDLDSTKPKASSGLLALLNTQPKPAQKEEKKSKPSDALLGLLTKSKAADSEPQTQVNTRVPSQAASPSPGPEAVTSAVASPANPSPGPLVNPSPVYPAQTLQSPMPTQASSPAPQTYPHNPGYSNPGSTSGLISSVPSEVDMLRLVSPQGATPQGTTPLPISEAELVASLTSQVSSPHIGTPLTEQDLIRSLQSQSATQLQAQLEGTSDGGDGPGGQTDSGSVNGLLSSMGHLHMPSQPTSEYVSEVESVPPALAPKPVRAVPKPLSEADLISHLQSQKLDDDDSDVNRDVDSSFGRDSSRSRGLRDESQSRSRAREVPASSLLDAELLALLKPSTPPVSSAKNEDNELMGLLKGGSEWRPRKGSKAKPKVEVQTAPSNSNNELMSLLKGSSAVSSTTATPTTPHPNPVPVHAVQSGSSELLSMLKGNQQQQQKQQNEPKNELLSMLKGPQSAEPKNELLDMLKGGQSQPKNELLDMLKGGQSQAQAQAPVQTQAQPNPLLQMLNGSGGSPVPMQQPSFQDPAIVQQSKPSASGSLLSLLNRGK